MPKSSKYTLLIICEGENTEPNFFRSIRDRILENKYLVEDMEITIWPEPKVDDDNSEISSDLRPKKPKRQLLKPNREMEPEIVGQPPLKWVLAGQQELKDQTYSEVWVVFDDDNHPAKLEAFEAARTEIHGKSVQIGYSSISFEYYLLLHFERINFAFLKSECRETKKPKRLFYCSTHQHPNDCRGERCVGGYARLKGYWDNSKGDISMYPLIEGRLAWGFWNSAWLRYQSDKSFGGPIYERNPYVTTDSIVKRLTGYGDKQYIFVPYGTPYPINDIEIQFDETHIVVIRNISKQTVIIHAEALVVVSEVGGEIAYQTVGARKEMYPDDVVQIDFAAAIGDRQSYCYYFSHGNYNVMVEN